MVYGMVCFVVYGCMVWCPIVYIFGMVYGIVCHNVWYGIILYIMYDLICGMVYAIV